MQVCSKEYITKTWTKNFKQFLIDKEIDLTN